MLRVLQYRLLLLFSVFLVCPSVRAQDKVDVQNCNISAIPQDNLSKSRFFFDIVCDEAAQFYSIEPFGGAVTLLEKKQKRLDERRCYAARKGYDYGVFLNNELMKNKSINHTCNLGNGYTVETVIDQNKAWKVHKEGYKKRRFYFFEDSIYLPYTAELSLLRNGVIIYQYKGIRGHRYGALDVMKFEIDINDEYVRSCTSYGYEFNCPAIKRNLPQLSKYPSIRQFYISTPMY